MKNALDSFYELTELIYKVGRQVQPNDTIPQTYGTEDLLYMAEIMTLRMIGKNPSITITEIATKSNKTKSAVSQIIDKLKEKNILMKIRNPEDQRCYILSMTKKGKVIFDYYEAYNMSFLNGLQSISIDEIETASKVLKAIYLQDKMCN